MNKKKNKMNKKIIKNLGSNFILWILIIIISLTVLQYVTTNTKTINISYKTFHDIVKLAFSSRRKVLNNTIKDYLKGPIIEKYSKLRPEECTIEDFITIVNTWYSIK